MSEEALVEREGPVIRSITWAELLRAHASGSQLMRSNSITTTLPRMGMDRTIRALANGGTRHHVLATGSFVAAAFAPLTVGGSLMLYVPPGRTVVEELISDLGLLHTDSASDNAVLLLQPPHDDVFTRPLPDRVNGIACVGLSQLALD